MKGILLVGAQFVLIALLLWPFTAPVWLLPSMLLALPAMALAFWTLAYNRPGNFNIRPVLKEGAQLITSGPYARVRHPMYVCVLWFGLAAALLYSSWLKLLLLLLLFAVLWMKAAEEEKGLRASFPAYASYAATVGRFLPKQMPG